jgi:ADP-ribose pyrophosphatase
MTIKIRRRRETRLSPWVTLVERELEDGRGESLGTFHSLAQADYVNVLAETRAGEIVLVEQFRSARETMTLELPGGLVEAGEEPASCALRELREETGYAAAEPPILLGKLIPDTGRLDNWCWFYHARNVDPVADWQPEDGVRRRLLSKPDFITALRRGEFLHALHIAAVSLAMIEGRF